MSLAAGTTTIPIATGLVVAVALFLAWVVDAVRRERARPIARPIASTTVRTAAPAVPVRIVVRPHYTVAAPGDAAVRAAMAHRVRPPVPLPRPVAVEAGPVREPVSAGLARTA